MPRPLLVLDDNPGDRAMVRAAFPDREVREGSTVEEGLAQLQDNPPAVILLDLGLPSCRGVESVETLIGPAHDRGVVVVVYSGRSPADEWAPLARRAGADGYVFKQEGRSVETLRRVLQQAIDEALSHRAYQRASNSLVGQELAALREETTALRTEFQEGRVETTALLQSAVAALERIAPPPEAEGAQGSFRAAWRGLPLKVRQGAWGGLAAGVAGALGWLAQHFGSGTGGGSASP